MKKQQGGGTPAEYEDKIYVGGVEIKNIRRNSSSVLTRSTLHIMDDKKRIAVSHNWTEDDNLRELNSAGELNTNKTRYQYGNHLDSASLELSTTASIISYEEYFPYGDTSFIAGTNQKEVKLKEYRYTGKEKDDVTGLYYYGARYYASWLGRWMSADPLFRENPSVYEKPKARDEEEKKKNEEEFKRKLYSEGLNLYGYVKGNPVNIVDPNGTSGDALAAAYRSMEERKQSVKKEEQKEAMTGSDNSDSKTVQFPAGEEKNINSGFGDPRRKDVAFHTGIDVQLPKGTQVKPWYEGKIFHTNTDSKSATGIAVWVQHKDKTISVYMHLDPSSLSIIEKMKVGDIVKKDTVIGYVGTTGQSSGYHLHTEIYSILSKDGKGGLDGIIKNFKDTTLEIKNKKNETISVPLRFYDPVEFYKKFSK